MLQLKINLTKSLINNFCTIITGNRMRFVHKVEHHYFLCKLKTSRQKSLEKETYSRTEKLSSFFSYFPWLSFTSLPLPCLRLVNGFKEELKMYILFRVLLFMFVVFLGWILEQLALIGSFKWISILLPK